MGRRPLLIAALALLPSACFVQFGELPDGSVGAHDGGQPGPCDCRIDGECRAALDTAPGDPCLECRPDRARDAWTDACAAAIVETSFEDFADGSMPRSLGNLYVSANGSVRVVRTSDVNLDGFPDLVVSNQQTAASAYTTESFVYFGSSVGLTPDARRALPTVGAVGNAIADLNADGWPDIVFASSTTGGMTLSYVYMGSRTGFSPEPLLLPTVGAHAVAVADLNADGWLDLVFANRQAPESYLYWGSPAGYSMGNRAALPTLGATGVAVADLNADGYLDILFSNGSNGTTRAVPSYVYWGSPAGFTPSARSDLPGLGPGDCAIADLDRDGFLDVVLPGFNDDTTFEVPTYVYLGASSGFSQERRLELPGTGAWGTTVADVDADGYLDVVLASYTTSSAAVTPLDSLVYLGAEAGPGGEPRRYPTLGARSAIVADFDRDGHLDLAFTSYHNGSSYASDSLVFRGTSAGPSPTAITPLPSFGAQISTTADLGNVYDRSDQEEYVSGPIELPAGATPTRIAWSADTPLGSSVRLSVRSAPTPDELADAPWRGSAPSEPFFARSFERLDVPPDHRYLQYRAVFRTPGFVSLPALTSVTIHYLPRE
ncbi:MAG TPA: VCBS repeat-containing protein [Sandaracinaceae bacterium]